MFDQFSFEFVTITHKFNGLAEVSRRAARIVNDRLRDYNTTG